MLRTHIKKVIIILIYLAIFSSLAIFLYFKFWPKPAETCLDGIMNQDEEKIDCGGVCEACALQPQYEIGIVSSGFLQSGAFGKYDLYAEIENPNNDFGSSKFEYSFIFKNIDGNVIAERSGTEFILPGEKKYIVENNVELENPPVSSELKITNPEWVHFAGYEKPQLRIVNKNYNVLNSGAGFSEAVGTLRNETPFEFNSIKIRIILKDRNQRIISLNSTAMNSVRSGENREFRSIWPDRFPGEVGNMEVQAEVNVFDSESFAKKYFDAREFQKFDYQYR